MGKMGENCPLVSCILTVVIATWVVSSPRVMQLGEGTAVGERERNVEKAMVQCIPSVQYYVKIKEVLIYNVESKW